MRDRTSEMTDSYTNKVAHRDTLPQPRQLQLHAPGGPARTMFGTSDNLLITQTHPYLSTDNECMSHYRRTNAVRV